MLDASDMELVRDYARRNSEEAFAALVQRHVNLVYSVALRHVGIAAHAEEITQAVFVILAQKAASLRPDTILEGWLYEITRLTALRFLRGERRRQFREQEAYMQSTLPESATNSAWEQLAPLLDEAMAQLGKKDRDAVVLRFFKDKSVREIAAALNVNEAAAQKRGVRALEKLRLFFAKRGVAVTTALIAGAVSANSVQAAPVALATSISAVAIAKGATASASTFTLIKGALKIMAWTKMKMAIVVGAGVLLAAGTTTVLIKKQNEAKQYAIVSAPWADVGAATPKAALQSLAWALTHDKFDRAQELVQWEEKGLSYARDANFQRQMILTTTLAPALEDIESFRVLSIESTNQPDELIVKIEKTFKKREIVPFAVTAKLRRVGGQWRAVGNIEYFESGNVSMLLPFTGSF